MYVLPALRPLLFLNMNFPIIGNDIVRLLLAYGADPNMPSSIKCQNKLMLCEMPLNIAIRERDYDLINLLLQYGIAYNKN